MLRSDLSEVLVDLPPSDDQAKRLRAPDAVTGSVCTLSFTFFFDVPDCKLAWALSVRPLLGLGLFSFSAVELKVSNNLQYCRLEFVCGELFCQFLQMFEIAKKYVCKKFQFLYSDYSSNELRQKLFNCRNFPIEISWHFCKFFQRKIIPVYSMTSITCCRMELFANWEFLRSISGC